MFECLFNYSIIKRAVEKNIISSQVINIRDFASGKHHITDDKPYGGGCGMVMKPEPIKKAVKHCKNKNPHSPICLLSPQGKKFNQQLAKQLTNYNGLILICGRYEGVDERVFLDIVDFELSIGDYILTGGEYAAMIIIDAVTRLLPGVLGGETSAQDESFENGLLEHANYTRPNIFENFKVPDILLSGNHKEIENWREESSLIRTFLKKPEMLHNICLKKSQKEILIKWKSKIEKIINSQNLSGTNSLSSSE